MDRWVFLLDEATDFMAGYVGKAVIEEDYVGSQQSRLLEGFGAAAGFAHNLDFWTDILNLAQTLAQGRMIINDQEFNLGVLTHGADQ